MLSELVALVKGFGSSPGLIAEPDCT